MTNLQNYQTQLSEERLALQITASLTSASQQLPHDVSERLRAARERAVSSRKVAVVKTAQSLSRNGHAATLTADDEPMGWWSRLTVGLSLVMLVVGLTVIHQVQTETRTQELAQIDAELLMDDLPTAAFTDPGFAEFLKLKTQHNRGLEPEI